LLTVVHDADGSNDNAGASRSLLDEIIRDGARQMLEAALKAEVAAYIEQFTDQLDDNGRRLVVRNGYHQPRDVLTAASAVTVVAPRINDKRVEPDSGQRHRFSSDPAGVGAHVVTDERGVAGAVSAWAVHR
jgi:putative transposase